MSRPAPRVIQRIVDWAVGLYGLLLAFYPPGFRWEHGAAARQLFRDLCRAALARGDYRGLLGVWGVTLAELVPTLLEQWGRAGGGRLPRWGGALGVMGGLLWLLGPLAPPLYLAFSILALLCLLAGLTGLAAYRGERAGWLERAGLALSALGAITLASSLLLVAALDQPAAAGGLFPASRLLYLGAVVIGVAGWRAGWLPWTAGLPLGLAALGALLLPVAVGLGGWAPTLDARQVESLARALAIFFGGAWALLGRRLWSVNRLARSPTATG